MLPLLFDRQAIHLQGLCLRGSILLTNPNSRLAIAYEVTPISGSTLDLSGDQAHQESIVEVFPCRGILLSGQSQSVHVRIKDADEVYSMDNLDSIFKIDVKYHFENNINKLLFKSGNLPQVDPIELFSYQGHRLVPLEISPQHHLQLQKQLEGEAMLSSTLGKQTMNISKISLQNNTPRPAEDEREFGTIINSLQINSKISGEEPQVGSMQSMGSMQSVGSISEFESDSNIGRSYFGEGKDIQVRKVSSSELLLLAVLAAFFFSLGSNISRLIL